MDKHYQALIDGIDNLMIAMCKQRNLGLDPEINEAIKKLTRSRREFKKALNLRLLTKNKMHEAAVKRAK